MEHIQIAGWWEIISQSLQADSVVEKGRKEPAEALSIQRDGWEYTWSKKMINWEYMFGILRKQSEARYVFVTQHSSTCLAWTDLQALFHLWHL